LSTLAFYQGLLTQERGVFVKVVQAVLDEGLEHRPDPKSRCSRELIEHMIGHNLDLAELLEDGVIHHRNQVPFDSVDDAVKQLDDSFGVVLEKLSAMDDSSWLEPAKFLAGEHLDSVHHRGQLSTHLRPMGSKVPSMYGPSADEEMAH
jgi:hypothetical protein